MLEDIVFTPISQTSMTIAIFGLNSMDLQDECLSKLPIKPVIVFVSRWVRIIISKKYLLLLNEKTNRMRISFRKGVVSAVIFTVALTCLAVTAESFVESESAQTEFALSSTEKFVKTNYRCTKCSCSGYWGYKHQNGIY